MSKQIYNLKLSCGTVVAENEEEVYEYINHFLDTSDINPQTVTCKMIVETELTAKLMRLYRFASTETGFTYEEASAAIRALIPEELKQYEEDIVDAVATWAERTYDMDDEEFMDWLSK